MQPAFIDANGIRFAYLEQGTGPLVLLVHGFPDTAFTWERVLPAVAALGFRAVAPFTRGYWPTEARGPYDSDTLGADLIALIEALGEQQAILVGHDWGASAAYAAAGSRPDRVRMLIALAIPHPKSLRPTPLLAWKLRHFVTLRRSDAAAKIRAHRYRYIDTLWRRWSPGWRDLPASETAQVKEAFAHEGCLEAACAYYAALDPRRLPAGHKLNIKVPSAAIAGEQDLIAPSAFERARRCFDGAYEVLRVPGGHFMHREHPAEFFGALTGALERLKSA